MSQTQASVHVVLVIENPDHKIHAAAALSICRGYGWIEVRDCIAAVEYLHSHSADLVLVLLQPARFSGLTLLRQVWHGHLLCFCEDSEDAFDAIEEVGGLAIIPPYATRQVLNALRLFGKLKLGKTSSAIDQSAKGILSRNEVNSEEALRENERRLEQAQRMEAVGRLAGGIAHDFNNLLTVIGSYSDLSMRMLDKEHVVTRYVEQIRKASSTAGTLTRQLLAFSRRQVLQPRVVALNEIVDEISYMVQSLLGSGIELRMQLDAELGQIEADPVQLQQVLLNLIVNAKDAMPDGGTLNLATSNFELDYYNLAQFPKAKPGSYVRLTVADTGTGMDAETMARIYEPFFTTKPKGRGTGLGLPMVYGIVQQSGGTISVHSGVGIGTTFHVYLPRVDKVAEHSQVEEEFKSTFSGHGTILLVEDEQSVRELASLILKEAGYQLLIAGTAEGAIDLEKSYEDRIDLLVTDVIMPRMAGRELANQLTRRRPQMPVLYISDSSEDVMVDPQFYDSGAHILEKPFFPNDLLRMVCDAIEQPEAPVALRQLRIQ